MTKTNFKPSAALKRALGFSLIELMVVVAIVGILASIAYPSYVEYVKKSARTEAMTAVLDTANKLEQYYVDNRSYTATLSDVGVNASTESGYYTLAVALGNGGQSFTVTATPASGPALDDSKCAAFSVTDTGAKGISGSGDTGKCWGK